MHDGNICTNNTQLFLPAGAGSIQNIISVLDIVLIHFLKKFKGIKNDFQNLPQAQQDFNAKLHHVNSALNELRRFLANECRKLSKR